MRIVEYRPEHEEDLLDLERESPQGSQIRIEMVRRSLQDRSRVFEDHQIYVLLGESEEVLGMAAAAAVEIELNGDAMRAGFCYDLRIKPAVRRRGLSRVMGRHVIRDFFAPRGIDRYFLTMKTSNTPVIRAAQSVLGLAHSWPFRYLTIPVTTQIDGKQDAGARGLALKIRAADPASLPAGWYRQVEEGVGVFGTHHMYGLRVLRVGLLARLAIRIVEWRRGEAAIFPRQADVLRTSTLCMSEVPSSDVVNRVLEDLRGEGVDYLMVVCRNGDAIARKLGPFAIASVEYLLVSNFAIARSDSLAVDARCM